MVSYLYGRGVYQRFPLREFCWLVFSRKKTFLTMPFSNHSILKSFPDQNNFRIVCYVRFFCCENKEEGSLISEVLAFFLDEGLPFSVDKDIAFSGDETLAFGEEDNAFGKKKFF